MLKCDICGEKATRHTTQTLQQQEINYGKHYHIHLCDRCFKDLYSHIYSQLKEIDDKIYRLIRSKTNLN